MDVLCPHNGCLCLPGPTCSFSLVCQCPSTSKRDSSKEDVAGNFQSFESLEAGAVPVLPRGRANVSRVVARHKSSSPYTQGSHKILSMFTEEPHEPSQPPLPCTISSQKKNKKESTADDEGILPPRFFLLFSLLTLAPHLVKHIFLPMIKQKLSLQWRTAGVQARVYLCIC